VGSQLKYYGTNLLKVNLQGDNFLAPKKTCGVLLLPSLLNYIMVKMRLTHDLETPITTILVKPE
jgi:hypothetical protein